MKLLDLFCGAGGAAVGYHRAGFSEIVGVDNRPQPRYPFAFVQADALEFLRGVRPGEFDLIHASPPCQRFSDMRHMHNAREYPDLLNPVRDLLNALGDPYVIENVKGAPLHRAIRLCGSSFGLETSDGMQLRRHRLFESNYLLFAPPCAHRPGKVIGFYGDHARDRRRTGGGDIVKGADKLRAVRESMGIDWMEWREACQAIPPAYTEWIGRQWLGQQEPAL